MKIPLHIGAAILVTAVPLNAELFSVNFDGVPSGTLANDVTPAGLTFEPAAYLPDVDRFGDPIPGTDKWRVDPLAPALTIENPADYGRGEAPSPAGALNALFQPTLIRFAGMTWVDFSVTLDNDPFGDPALDLLFLDGRGRVVGTVSTDQTVPGFMASRTGLIGVSEILLPAGAFYDNLTMDVVPIGAAFIPEGGTVLAGIAMGLLGLARWYTGNRRR